MAGGKLSAYSDMCLNPKFIYKKGRYKCDNYRGMKNDFYELGTYSKCGACIVCQNEKANNWVVRNFYESKNHKKICFVTLTYENNPIFLVKKDLQDFLKRFRRKLDYKKGEKIRYFAAGEYGTRYGRAHYHLIIYGWTDPNAYYIGQSNRKNLVYQSKLIQECWGLGRTSYQEFAENEIPYMTLYETPKETFKKAYKLTREKVKQIERYLQGAKMADFQRRNLYKELEYYEKQMEQEKAKYVLIREFNTWSIGLGWANFEKEYDKYKNYTFTEYIQDKEFVTPSPWVKKLANQGDINAAIEMFKREEDIIQSATEQEERGKALKRVLDAKKKELKELQKDVENDTF